MEEWANGADAVATHLHHSDTVAKELFAHLIPFAAECGLIRPGQRKLLLIRGTLACSSRRCGVRTVMTAAPQLKRFGGKLALARIWIGASRGFVPAMGRD